MYCTIGVYVFNANDLFSMLCVYLREMFVYLQIAVNHRAQRRRQLVERGIVHRGVNRRRQIQGVLRQLFVQPLDGRQQALAALLAVTGCPLA